MSDPFYCSFEDRHRGRRDVIKSQLAVYRPFVEPLILAYPAAAALDIGCGRGEWLEILADVGFKARGVDLDETMVALCHELDLDVKLGDGIAYLSGLADASLSLISAFHVIEHVNFEELRKLVAEAVRVLRPGGLLILETPNPENVVVATRNFYLDPSHIRPIPPDLLSFVAEYYGFARVKTLRLQESAELHQRSNVGLQDVLAGVSPDYAVVAQKQDEGFLMESLAPLFARKVGLGFNELAARFDARIEANVESTARMAEHLAESARQAEARAQQAESRAQQAESRAQQAESRAQRAESLAQQTEQRWREAEARGQQLESRLASSEAGKWELSRQVEGWRTRVVALENSNSWRVTRPLRALGSLAKGDASSFMRETRAITKRVIQGAGKAIASTILSVLDRPRIRAALSPALKRAPWLHQALRRVAVGPGAIPVDTSAESRKVEEPVEPAGGDKLDVPSRARRIFGRLKGSAEHETEAR